MKTLLLSLALAAPALAQTPEQLVTWDAVVSAAPQPTLSISAHIQPGWHVYAQTQGGDGPTPLRISVDANALAESAGAPTGTVAQKKFDRGFGFETQFYTDAFTLQIPLRLKSGAATPINQPIPITLRFQNCSDKECRPPVTLHLSARLAAQRPT
ncbi:MAG: protein-disulfide reductase DsbD family protein [Steroidobacteraceae bacterium]